MYKYRNIDLVICAAGSGSRFTKSGIKTPKVKINLLGKTFLERSLESLDLLPGDRVVLIVQKSQEVKSLFKKINSLYPWVEFKLIELSTKTNGQLTTFLKSKRYLRKDCSLVIWNCDTYFKSIELNSLIRNKTHRYIVPCGKLPGDHWSFFKTNKQGYITDVKEKKRISPWCSVGFYHFHSSKEVINISEKIIKNTPSQELKEHYVSSLYPILLKKGKKIYNCSVDHFMPFGTPDEVLHYWKVSNKKLLETNK